MPKASGTVLVQNGHTQDVRPPLAAPAEADGLAQQPGNGSVSCAAGSHPKYRFFGQATPGPTFTLRPVLAHVRPDRLGTLGGDRILFLGPEAKRPSKAAAAHGPQSLEVQERLSRILLVRVDVALMFLLVLHMVARPSSS